MDAYTHHEIDVKKILLPDSYYEYAYCPPELSYDKQESIVFYLYPLETAHEMAICTIVDPAKRRRVTCLIRSAIKNMKKALKESAHQE